MAEALVKIEEPSTVSLPMALLDKCVHCGFCLPACPTYVLWGDEMDSPRGRIWMMRKSTVGEAKADDNLRTHIDNCLGCMSCMTACPSGVEYNKLIEETRAQLGVPIALYQKSGLQAVVRRLGLLRVLPKRLQAMEALMPAVPLNPFRTLPQMVKSTARPLGRVGMLTGCVQDAYFQPVNAATVRVLTAIGYEVVVPKSQGCCGALMVHSGLEHEAQAYAKRMIAQFELAGVEWIAINAAGCGSTMKEYAHLLRDDPAWVGRAERFSAKCRDISELLAAAPIEAQLAPLPMRVAYHDACHLRHAQGIHAEPRALLAQVPELAVAEMAESNLCCGSAGVYNLLHPETAEELGDRKVQHLLETKAQALVSANPGCLLQLQASLRRNGYAELPTFHMVELLDASLRGVSVDELLKAR
jgi:glycolate oxidase iron-sulfur subunit